MDKKAVIVLGMHRSGTSAVAAALEAIGVSLGNKSDWIDDDNRKGYFENKDIIPFNDRLLKFLHGRWDNPLFDGRVVIDEYGEERLSSWYEEADEIFNNNFAEETIWALKDPRMCQLLPFWKKVFERNGFGEKNIYYVHVLRNPLEVALSQKKRHEKNPDFHFIGDDPLQTILLWLSSHLQAMREVNSDNNTAIFFDDLLDIPNQQLKRLADFLGIDLSEESMEDFVSSFLEKEMKHHHSSSKEIEELYDEFPLIEPFYNTLKKLSKKERFGRNEIRSALSSLEPYNQVYRLFLPIYPLISDAWYKWEQEKRGHEGLISEHEGLKAEHQRLDSEHEGLKIEHEGLRTEHEELRTGNEVLKLEHEGLKSEHEGLKSEHQGLKIEHEGLRTEHEELRAGNEVLKLEHEGLKSEYEGLKSEHQGLKTEHQGLQSEYESLKSEHEGLKSEHQGLRAELQDLKSKYQGFKTEYDLLKSEHEGLRINNKMLKSEHRALKNNLDALKSAHDELEAEHTALKVESKGFKSKHGGLKIEHEGLRAEHHRVKVEYQEILESYTWKLANRIRLYLSQLPVGRYFIRLFKRIDHYICWYGETSVVRKSKYFDKDWYLKTYPDVASSRINPLRHYLTFGWKEGRDPGPDFSTSFYLYSFPDVKKDGYNPLLHYLRFGRSEGRVVHPAGWSGPAVEKETRRLTPYQSWLEVNIFNDNRFKAFKSAFDNLGLKGSLSLKSKRETFVEHFLKIAENMQVVTFDVFDTLLERKVLFPEDLFAALEAWLFKEEIYSGPFKTERVYAERKARDESAYEEVTLGEIYETWQAEYGAGDDVVEIVKGKELEFETRYTAPRPVGREMYDRARSSGKRIFLISDTYLSDSYMRQLLEEVEGYADYDALYVSSEYRATKHTGRLFEKFLDAEGFDPESVLHVGDNPGSDGESAKRAGLRSLVIPKSAELSFKQGRLQHLGGLNISKEDISITESSISGLIAHKLAVDSTDDSDRELDPYSLGYSVMGPMFAGFAAFVAKTAVKRGYKKLYFVSRDGYYMKAAYDILAESVPDLPDSYYLLSSRKLCNFASLENSEDILRVADVDYFPCPLKDLLINRFNLTSRECSDIPRSLLHKNNFSDINEMVDRRINHNHFVDLSIDLKETIVEKAAEIRENYYDYLCRQGVGEPGACIVDIGYSGTTQSLLSRLLGKEIGGIYFITWEKAKSMKKSGLVFDSFMGHMVKPDHEFNRYIQLFELSFSGTHPSVNQLFYNGVDKEFAPDYDSFILPQNIIINLAEMHLGGVEFTRDFFQTNAEILNHLEDSQPETYINPAMSFFKNPAPEGALMFSDVIFEDRFGGQDKYLTIAPDHFYDLPLDRALELSYWREGTESLFSKNGFEPVKSRYSLKIGDGFIFNGEEYRCVDNFNGPDIIPGYLELEPNEDVDAQQIEVGSVDRSGESLDKASVKGSDGVDIIVIVGVSDRWVEDLDTFLSSLSHQLFNNWEVIVMDASSESSRVAEIIDDWEYGAARLRHFHVGGDFNQDDILQRIETADLVLFADSRCVLEQDLVADMVMEAVQNGADFIYTDHDNLVDGVRGNPEFKPDWSPELLMAHPYIGRIYAMSNSVALQSFEAYSLEGGGSIYNHLLVSTEHASRIAHIPRILWHDGEAGEGLDREESLSFLEDALQRRGIKGKAVEIESGESGKDRRFLSVQFPDEGPNVAVIIPTKNNYSLLSRCVASLDKTTYKNYKTYIVDNGNDDPEVLEYFKKIKGEVLNIPSPESGFNFSYLNNQAVKMVEEEYVLFLNDDTEVINPRWLSQMVGWLGVDGVGAVGARLLFKDGRIQHAGIVNRLNYNLPAPAYKLLDGDDPGYLGHAMATRNYSAVTAACMLTSRELFEKFDGFNETEFGVAYNDCDYGFRLTKAGYRNVYCPEAELYHYEGASRGIGVGNDKPSEEAECIKRYGDWSDPFYNRNLALNCTDFSIGSGTVARPDVSGFRAAMVTHNLNLEGAPFILFNITCGLKKHGLVDPVVISPLDGPLRGKLEALGIEVHVLKDFEIFGAKDVVEYKKNLFSVIDILKMCDAELVFANTVLTWWAIDAAAQIGLPSIWAIHESEEPFSHLTMHGLYIKERAKRCLHFPYQIVFPSGPTLQLFYPHLLHNNYCIVHNGYDPSRLEEQVTDLDKTTAREQLGIANRELMALMVGTVCERKNQVEFIEGIKGLPKSLIEKTHFFVIGDIESDYSSNLHLMIKRLPKHISKRIHLIPVTEYLGKFYLAADIFVLTSLVESYPVVVQEAMYFGLPIIVNPAFGIREQVHDEVSALYYESGDVGSLTGQLERLLNSNELREKLGHNAKDSFSRIPTYEMTIENYVKIFTEAWLSQWPRSMSKNSNMDNT